LVFIACAAPEGFERRGHRRSNGGIHNSRGEQRLRSGICRRSRGIEIPFVVHAEITSSEGGRHSSRGIEVSFGVGTEAASECGVVRTSSEGSQASSSSVESSLRGSLRGTLRGNADRFRADGRRKVKVSFLVHKQSKRIIVIVALPLVWNGHGSRPRTSNGKTCVDGGCSNGSEQDKKGRRRGFHSCKR